MAWQYDIIFRTYSEKLYTRVNNDCRATQHWMSLHVSHEGKYLIPSRQEYQYCTLNIECTEVQQ